MPFTTVVPSTTITAAWGNANVRNQVVTPFADDAARTSAVTSPVEGMVSYLSSYKALYMHNGSAYVRVAPKGRVGGNRYNAGTTIIIAAGGGIGPGETLTGMTTPALTLEKNRSFEIRVRLRVLASSAGQGIVMRVRETNVSGTVRALYNNTLQSNGITYEKEFVGYYDTGASDEAKTYVLTGATSGGAANFYAGDSTTAVYIDVFDVGPAGSLSVV